ncbi:hypothetical protein C119_63 [Escherichia phage C119]|uniref:Uncharacterized protein n=1 Tax=Escherichia phage C119 TaxID=1735565 RepID=A0A0P0J055_9CAUD|nr:hypothetical protein FDI75_gp63 [Escherichia phage C119]ALJ98943.1 hypothetical protein C119_63 [Escherichia phage C119]
MSLNFFKTSIIEVDEAVYFHENHGFDTECLADEGMVLIVERDEFSENVKWSEK